MPKKLGSTVNRTAIILRPRQPFIDWINAVVPDPEKKFEIDDVSDDSSVYLLPEGAYDEEYAGGWLGAFKRDLFERQLEDWCLDPAQWPQKLTERLFDRWFEIDVHSMVIDLCADPLKRERF